MDYQDNLPESLGWLAISDQPCELDENESQDSFSTTTCSSSAPPTFRRFADLPLEIREKVWQWTFPRDPNGRRHRRLEFEVDIRLHRDPRRESKFYDQWDYLDSELRGKWDDKEGNKKRSLDSIRASNGPKYPMALQVCFESRRNALEHYTLLFDFKGRENVPRTTPTYYNADLDIVSFEGNGEMEIDQTPLSHYGFHWLQQHAPLDLDSIWTLEMRGRYVKPRYEDQEYQYPFWHLEDEPDKKLPRLPDRKDQSNLLYYFRRLKFLNLIDYHEDLSDWEDFYTHLKCPKVWWKEPDTTKQTKGIRQFIKRQQVTDPTYSLPSIRFAPSDTFVEDVLSQWPEELQGKDGEDVFLEAQ